MMNMYYFIFACKIDFVTKVIILYVIIANDHSCTYNNYFCNIIIIYIKANYLINYLCMEIKVGQMSLIASTPAPSTVVFPAAWNQG